MNELLMEKLEELFRDVDNCPEVIEMLELKEQIYKDEYLKELLEKYRNIFNNYDPKIKDIKKQIIEHPLVNKYRLLENELYFTILEMNQKFEKLFDKKRCNDAHN